MLGAIFPRNSFFVATIFAGAFAFESFFDTAVTAWYKNHNKGKLWHDVRPRFLEGGDEDEDEDDE
ncbi:cytochrome b-c1 complex subunit 9, mitochondrial [[Candida] jaroonii]|uniref:Cytochrome b-c1 complex subunit 9, mitochondrial n=1 Tax=[Candida] jaroonii TaxID=467808 RepID=A0ACA9YC94_9ASCO|nr:cytochrome b-c1 complex subunit 9, mitochondrial [[Candida] jaroonii]